MWKVHWSLLNFWKLAGVLVLTIYGPGTLADDTRVGDGGIAGALLAKIVNHGCRCCVVFCVFVSQLLISCLTFVENPKNKTKISSDNSCFVHESTEEDDDLSHDTVEQDLVFSWRFGWPLSWCASDYYHRQ